MVGGGMRFGFPFSVNHVTITKIGRRLSRSNSFIREQLTWPTNSMKKIVDLLSILFIAALPLSAIYGLVLASKHGQLRSRPLIGFAPWEIEVMLLDILPFLFGAIWLSFRYSNIILRHRDALRTFIIVVASVAVLLRLALLFFGRNHSVG
jgi:hypothetical protein